MKVYNVKVNGKVYEVEVEEVKKHASNESEPVVKSEDKKPEKKPPVNPGAGSVMAPMPGKILDVRVEEGQIVKTGDVLLILEAMKMENEISAHVDGKITAIYVAKDQSVNSGDVLITID